MAGTEIKPPAHSPSFRKRKLLSAHSVILSPLSPHWPVPGNPSPGRRSHFQGLFEKQKVVVGQAAGIPATELCSFKIKLGQWHQMSIQRPRDDCREESSA